jgi:hypothetical protein
MTIIEGVLLFFTFYTTCVLLKVCCNGQLKTKPFGVLFFFCPFFFFFFKTNKKKNHQLSQKYPIKEGDVKTFDSYQKNVRCYYGPSDLDWGWFVLDISNL